MTLAALAIDDRLPVTFTSPGLSEEEFLELLAEFPNATVEYHADGTVTLMPPTDPETSERVGEIVSQLRNWTRQYGGRFSGPDGGFRFPDGSRLAPDASWFDAERWKATKTPGIRFPVFSPEFVIEVRSPDDRLRPLQEKMQEYIDNGVLLAWLIDPIKKTATIYRPGVEPMTLDNPATLAGDGPMKGFVLDLKIVFSA
ncbi:MAG: Uma2 family endonuclease [Acidobacteriota bacterium]